MSWKLGLLASAVAALSIAATPANAAIQTGTLNLITPNFSGATAPFGTVKLTWDSDSPDEAIVEFKANTIVSGSTTYTYAFFGSQGVVGINTNGTATLLGAITSSQAGWAGATHAPGYAQDPGGSSMDGFGNFNFVLDQTINPNGIQAAATYIKFTIQKDSGSWLSVTNILTPNGNLPPAEYLAVGHVYASTNGGTSANIATGFVADGGFQIEEPTVPEPMSLAIWGLGLGACGLVGARRRIRKA